MFGIPLTKRITAHRFSIVLALVACAWTARLPAQTEQIHIHLDEAKVGPYTLPDPLIATDGQKVGSRQAWIQQRRPELLRIFEDQVYGKVPRPDKPLHITSRVRSEDKAALGGTAVRREITISFSEAADGPRLDLLMYLPKMASRARPVPAFLGLNFEGNHTIHSDPGIALARGWVPNNPAHGIKDHRAADSARGASSSRWQVERVLERGYAIVTAYYGDIDPDFDDGFQNGVQPLFYHPGQTRPAPDEWGSIAAWAWGLSRALDTLESVPEIDAHKVVVHGHSRLGKTSLWAGATDPRFAIVIANESGCGGAALSKRNFGETVLRINTSFPHWFCTTFRQYNGGEDRLPIDQHELIALIAPRPVLICSAAEDLWADPKGEFLAALGASPVYKLLGTDGLAVDVMPAPATGQLTKSTIGYHIRPGKHDVTADDWDAFMNFADYHLHRLDRERQ
jgi:(4-O-methyl)-D-glucuronate---lignin esterase